MNAVVDPDGPSLTVIPSNPVPEGAQVGYFTASDKVRLRYARFPRTAGSPRGTICLLGGRAEYIEKYFETVVDFQSRGFAVASFDWRGQGGSQRLTGSSRLGYVKRFDDYWEDLRAFHSTVLLPDCPAPYYLVAHSMGGLVGLLAGLRDRLMFERILLSAPMVGLDNMPLGPVGMARLGAGLCLAGLGRLPVARGSDKPLSAQGFAGNTLTSDANRFNRNAEILKAAPALEIGAPSLRWVSAAFAAMAEVNGDGFPLAVRVPVLMLAAARDEVVSTSATETLGLRMRTGRHLIVPGARHELLQENDAIRGQVLAAFDAFIGAGTA